MLRDLYPVGVPLSDLAKMFNRSIHAVEHRVTALRLRRKIRGGAKKPWREWTPAQEDVLRQLWPHASRWDIMAALSGFTWGAIRVRAAKLGLLHITPARGGQPISREPLPLSSVEAAYIAGIIDGEGTISLAPHRGVFTPIVSIYNTSLPLIEWLAQRLPKALQLNRMNSPGRFGVTRQWYLRVGGYNVYPVLVTVAPYLVVKKRHADLLMEFFQLRFSKMKYQYGERERIIAMEIKELNQRKSSVPSASPSMDGCIT